MSTQLANHLYTTYGVGEVGISSCSFFLPHPRYLWSLVEPRYFGYKIY